MTQLDGRQRVVIEGIRPQIDGGRFPIKRTVGEFVVVEADVYVDGHDSLSAAVLYRRHDDTEWMEVPMQPLVNDRWRAEFTVTSMGRYEYTVQGWVDRFLTWRRDLTKRVAAEQDVRVDLLIGAELIDEALQRADATDADVLRQWARRLRSEEVHAHLQHIGDDVELGELMSRWSPRQFLSTYGQPLTIEVDRERAGLSAWYEMFPRSASAEPGRHGTFRDVESRLPYVASMGFNVLYLPPVHPIGTAFRKGRNNTPEAAPDDVGSPWGIGSQAGGHKAVHPELGTLDDFRNLVEAAAKFNIEIALDIAFQCSPDHPYVRQHPEWFRKRPDGTIQYAENPPKKYQDIYPFDFETDDWQALWDELKSIFEFWIDQGVRIFRVDNPHTKPFVFWEWCLGELKREHPDALFLSEAFTRPKMMYRLAKIGFTQSYTYFSWRNTKQELVEYLTELTTTEVREYFRPNFWPNTPDILTEHLQVGKRPAFISRLILAATLSPNYGIYGPPFEHCWSEPREPGSEEYLNSEKYELHYHPIDRPDSLKDVIAHVNHIRREHVVLQSIDHLQFHPVDNDELICFSKSSHDQSEILLIVVNLDPHHTQSGWVDLPLEQFRIDPHHPYQVHDLLGDARYLWHGPRNYVELNPAIFPAHIFRLRRRTRSERDFEYFM